MAVAFSISIDQKAKRVKPAFHTYEGNSLRRSAFD
jgi:hypothetical protein